MKVYITTKGDISKGSWGSKAVIDWNTEPIDDEDREVIREEFASCFAYLCNEEPTVLFSDECSLCLSRLDEKGKCQTKSCFCHVYDTEL